MGDMNKLLGKLLSSGAAGSFAGGMAGGLTSSMLAGKKGRKLSKKAIKMGGIAAVGALAYGAFQKYNSAKAADPAPAQATASPSFQEAPAGSPFLPPQNDTASQEQLGLTLVRAMIAAARSDGRLDAQESQAIFQKIESLDITQDEKDLLVQEMGRPVDMDGIVRSATTPEVAAEIYIASLLAIDVDTVEEQSYLGMLAARLKLPRELVTELHSQVDAQTAAAG